MLTDSGVWETPEVGGGRERESIFMSKIWIRLSPYRPKHCGNNNKDEDNSPKTLYDKNHQASSQKLRQLKI